MTTPVRSLLGLGLAALLLLFAAACDSSNGDADDGADGESSFALSGDITKSTDGARAVFATGAEVDPQGTPGILSILYRTTATDTTWLLLFSEGSNTLPRTGTYDVVEELSDDPSEYAALYLSADEESLILATGVSGTVTFSRSESGRLEGSFDVTGVGFETDVTSESLRSLSLEKARALTREVKAKNNMPRNVSMRGTFRARRADGAEAQQLIDELGIEESGIDDVNEIPSEPTNLGRSEFTVENESTTRSYDGFALFGLTEDTTNPNQDAFAISLFTDPERTEAEREDGAVLFLIYAGVQARPSPGTYDVADVSTGSNPVTGTFFAFMNDTDDGFLVLSGGGTVTITASSPDGVDGQLAFTGFAIRSGTFEAYDVAGSFEAVSGDVGNATPTIF
jgi:hypothetical protein